MTIKQLVFENAVRDLATGQYLYLILIDAGTQYNAFIRDLSQPPTQPANVAQITSSGALPIGSTAPPGSLTIGTAIGGGAANRVLFENAGNVLAEGSNLAFNSATGLLS